jgi:hypothetical protein
MLRICGGATLLQHDFLRFCGAQGMDLQHCISWLDAEAGAHIPTCNSTIATNATATSSLLKIILMEL